MSLPDTSFYATAAQIIPVLFLALAFQARGGFFPSLLEEDWQKYRDRRAAGKTKAPSDEEMARRLEAAGHRLPTTREEMDALSHVLRREAERAADTGRAIAGAISLSAMLVLVVGE